LRVVFIVVCFINLLIADSKVLDIYIGGEMRGAYLFEDKNSTLISDEPIIFGNCKSNNILDIAESYIIKDDEKLLVTPLKKCLSEKDIFFSKRDKHFFKKSNSAYLNYALSNQNNNYSASLGSGIYAYDALLYFQGNLNQKDSAIENYFILKEFDDKKIKFGKIYATSGSYLTTGYSLNGISFYQNSALTHNSNAFDYQLTVSNKSTIEIYNNDKLVQKLSLNPGIYNLKELPITYFSNNIKIVLRDSFGNEKEIVVPFLYNSKILKEGRDEYSLSSGVDEKNSFKIAGFYRKGITEKFTAGVSFDTNNAAFLSDYLTSIGKIGLHVDANKNTILEYSYSKSDFYFNASNTYKDRENDFRVEGGLNFNKWGNLSLKYHKNGETIYGADYILNASSNLNFTLNSSFNETKDDYRVGLRFAWNFNLSKRHLNLIASNTKYSTSNSRYISASMPISGDEGIGFDANYDNKREKTGYSTKNSRLSIKAKYKNEFWINSQNLDNTTNIDYGLSGTIGCVFSNSINCGIGENVYPESGFILKEHTLKKATPYFNTMAQNQFNSTQITLKSGQGYWLDPTLYKNITGVILLNGKPYEESTFVVNNKEYFTGYGGEFWVENFINDMDSFVVQIPNTICFTKFLNIDEELNEVQINCKEKRDD